MGIEQSRLARLVRLREVDRHQAATHMAQQSAEHERHRATAQRAKSLAAIYRVLSERSDGQTLAGSLAMRGQVATLEARASRDERCARITAEQASDALAAARRRHELTADRLALRAREEAANAGEPFSDLARNVLIRTRSLRR